MRKGGEPRGSRCPCRAQGQARQVQAAKARVFCRRIAKKRPGQGAKERAARDLCANLRARRGVRGIFPPPSGSVWVRLQWPCFEPCSRYGAAHWLVKRTARSTGRRK